MRDRSHQSKSTLQGSNIAILKGTSKSETHADRVLAKATIGGFARALLSYHVEQLKKDPYANEATLPDLIENLERVILSITGNARFINPPNGRILHYEFDTTSDTLTARYMPIEHVRFTDDMIAIYPQALPAAVMNRLLSEGPTRDKHGQPIMTLSDLIDIPLPGYNPRIMDIGRDQSAPDTPLVLSTLRDTRPWLDMRKQILSGKGKGNGIGS